jgi:5-methyltetrahydrofolate--homocysteine methyltransferase
VLGLKNAAAPEDVLVAKGNCGIPEYRNGHIHYSGTPEIMADYARLARACGARIVGGCCGTTPVHLAAMRAALDREEDAGPVPDLAAIAAALGPVTDPAAAANAAEPRAERRRRRG